MDGPQTALAAGTPVLLGLLLLLLAFLAGSVAVWVLVLVRCLRGQPLVAWQPRRCVPWSGLDMLLCAVIYLVVLAAVGGLLRALGHEVGEQTADPTQLVELISLNAAATLVATACAVGAMRLRGATWQDLGLAPGRLLADCRLGLAAFLFIGPGVYALQLVLSRYIEGQHPLVDMVQGGGAQALLLAAFSALLVAPLCEEWLFRVLFQGWLEKLELMLVAARLQSAPAATASAPAAASQTTGDSPDKAVIEADIFPQSARTPEDAEVHVRASPPELHPAREPRHRADQFGRGLLGLPQGGVPILLSSGIFALMHSGQGPAPIPLFLFALCLGYLYHQTHRLVPSLVVHLCLNALSMLMLCVMVLYDQA